MSLYLQSFKDQFSSSYESISQDLLFCETIFFQRFTSLHTRGGASKAPQVACPSPAKKMKLAGEVFHAKNQDCPPSETFVRKHVIFTGGVMSWEQHYCSLPPIMAHQVWESRSRLRGFVQSWHGGAAWGNAGRPSWRLCSPQTQPYLTRAGV